MFCISIALKDTQLVWTLLYKTEEAANSAWMPIQASDGQGGVILHDDFGQTAAFKMSCVAGAMLENLDESMLAHIERGLHNARTQAKAQQVAINDPILKTAAMTAQGPAIFNPVGNGFAPHRR